jgi:hypothetical protein
MMEDRTQQFTPFERSRIFNEVFGTKYINGVEPDERFADVVRRL